MSKFIISEVDDALVVSGAGEPVDLWNDLRKHFTRLRGARRGRGGLRYPSTTNRDVLSVVAILDRELAAAPRDAASLATERALWRRAAARVERLVGAADDVYSDNDRFWLGDAKRLAVYLSVARHLPTQTEMLADLAELTRHRPRSTPTRNGRRAA
jgi:hypothetical protein